MRWGKTNEYFRIYMLKRYKERMAWALAELGGQCVACGTRENLELDHRDPATKDFTVGSLWSCAWAKFVAEVAKCQLLCEAHHKIKSAAEARAKVAHGTEWMYRLGCRCDECTAAKRDLEKTRSAIRRQRRVAQG